MKKVIIAEKPSLARNIIQILDNVKSHQGYYENDEYIITFTFGHLFKLYDIEMYYDNYDKDTKYPWSLNNLPFFPEQFKFGLNRDEGIIKQYKIIRDLVNRDDVDTIINAGDSDREGEIIIRIILKYALKKDKIIKRLWMPDQTPETIKEELSLSRDDKDYDNLANEGFARTYLDWVYGINLTRYATIKGKSLLRVGRVISPIVQEIYNRDKAIKEFVPKKYYVLVSKEKTNGEEVELILKEEFSSFEEAQAKAAEYNKLTGYVKNITSEKKLIPPGKLFSLSKLQGELGKKYRYSLDTSLKIVQSLYENGYVSYPRTPSQYLGENEKPKFRAIIENFKKMGVNIVFKDSKSIFDDSKIESHSALTPTYKIPKKSQLNEQEYNVYKMIANRFFAVFAKVPFAVNRSTMEIVLSNGKTFKLTGDIILTKGWTEFENREKKEKILPNLQIGDEVNILFKPVEKETKPPKHYTVETLNNFLKNPFKDNLKELNEEQVEEAELKAMFEGVELGTEATRSSIIDNAIKQEYILLKDNTYTILDKGIYYVETLQKLNIVMPKEKTAELGKNLKKVYRNEISIDESIEYAKGEIREIFDNALEEIDLGYAPHIFAVDKERTLCKCPKCKNIIAISDKGFRCNNNMCNIALYYDNKLFASLNQKVTKKLAKEIFTKGRVSFKGLISKKNKPYDADLVADFSSKYLSFKFEFPNNTTSEDPQKKQ